MMIGWDISFHSYCFCWKINTEEYFSITKKPPNHLPIFTWRNFWLFFSEIVTKKLHIGLWCLCLHSGIFFGLGIIIYFAKWSGFLRISWFFFYKFKKCPHCASSRHANDALLGARKKMPHREEERDYISNLLPWITALRTIKNAPRIHFIFSTKLQHHHCFFPTSSSSGVFADARVNYASSSVSAKKKRNILLLQNQPFWANIVGFHLGEAQSHHQNISEILVKRRRPF